MPEHSVVTDPNIHEPKGVAAAASGTVYTANGAGSGSWAAIPTTDLDWTLVKKTADQSITSSTSFADDTHLTFSMLANTTYAIRVVLGLNCGAGSFKVAINGPASPTRINANIESGREDSITAYNTSVIESAGTGTRSEQIQMWVVVTNGANAGTFVVRLAQYASSAVATVYHKGSFLEYAVIA